MKEIKREEKEEEVLKTESIETFSSLLKLKSFQMNNRSLN